MAELVLSDEEKAAQSYLDAVMLLVGDASEINAERVTLKLDDHTHNGEPTGDWVILIKRVKKP